MKDVSITPSMEELLPQELVEEYKSCMKRSDEIWDEYCAKLREIRKNFTGKIFFREPCHYYKILDITEDLNSSRYNVFYVNDSKTSATIDFGIDFEWHYGDCVEITEDRLKEAIKRAKNNISKRTGYEV